MAISQRTGLTLQLLARNHRQICMREVHIRFARRILAGQLSCQSSFARLNLALASLSLGKVSRPTTFKCKALSRQPKQQGAVHIRGILSWIVCLSQPSRSAPAGLPASIKWIAEPAGRQHPKQGCNSQPVRLRENTTFSWTDLPCR
jgi:hypothetical protein